MFVGSAVTLTVGATGTDPLAYRWHFNTNTPLPEAATSSLTLSPVQAFDEGGYSVVVTNLEGSVTSRVAQVKVDWPQPDFTAVADWPLDGSGSYGAAFGDYDGDGWLDLFIARYGTTNSLYRNQGDGTLTDMTGTPLTSHVAYHLGAAWGDADNDGDLDLVVTRTSGDTNSLYLNEGRGVFTTVTASPLSLEAGNFQQAIWGDYDQDGYLDLFIARWGEDNRLFHNCGGGRFEQVVGASIVGDGGDSAGAAWADSDNDGDLDLFVANGANGNDLVYVNDGQGEFASISSPPLGDDGLYGHGVSWGDYDNDGDLDLVVVNLNQPVRLYRNEGAGAFAAMDVPPLTTESLPGTAATWADYDNDGDLDLYLAAQDTSANRLYGNQGVGVFEAMDVAGLTTDLTSSQCAAWADVDRDGDLDLYVSNSGDPPEDDALYLNDGNGATWLQIELRRRSGQRGSLGAIVRLSAKIKGQDTWQMRQVGSDVSYLSQGAAPIHFGLGDATNVTELRVEWPGGGTTVLTNLAPSQFVTIAEAPPSLYLANHGQGSVTVSGLDQPNLIDQPITLTAVPDDGHEFVAWADGHTNPVRSVTYGWTNSHTAVFANSEPMETRWPLAAESTLGGAGEDSGVAVVPAANGGWFVGATSDSFVSGTKTLDGYGGTDFWLQKLDAECNVIWERVYGGSLNDTLEAMCATSDGGVLLGGSSYSEADGNKSATNLGNSDFWVIKVDAQGLVEWDYAYGGSGQDFLRDTTATHDGGFVLIGSIQESSAGGTRTAPAYGVFDVWVVKLDASGAQLWDRSYGGGNSDSGRRIVTTADGFWVAATSASDPSGNKTTQRYGGMDWWLLKLSQDGFKRYERSYGGALDDYVEALVPTADGGVILGGSSDTMLPGLTGNKTATQYGSFDFWLLKLDIGGQEEWQASYGGDGIDQLANLTQLPNGSYVAVGMSDSLVSGTKTVPSYGGRDLCVVGLNPWGELSWQQTLGGTEDDTGSDLTWQGEDLVLVGTTESDASGSKLSTGHGGKDLWVLDLRPVTKKPGTPIIRVNGFVNASGPLSFRETDEVVVELDTTFTDGHIFYSLQADQPPALVYAEPFQLEANATIRAIAYSADYLAVSDEATPLGITILPVHELTAHTAGGGTVSLDPPGGTYVEGTLVSVSAAADPGWEFKEWSGAEVGASPTVKVTMDGPKSLEAIFGTSLTAVSAPPGSGSVLIQPEQPWYAYGSRVRLTAVPTAGRYLSVWGGSAAGETANPLELTVMNAELTVSALFALLAPDHYALTTRIEGQGQVTRDPDTPYYAGGTRVSLSASPAPNWRFEGWSGDAASGEAELEIDVDDNQTVVATFVSLANQSPLATWESPSAGAVFTYPEPIDLRVTAADPDGQIVRVEFYADQGLLGQVDAAPYEFTWGEASPGDYELTAVAVDDQGARGTSDAVNISVLTAPPLVSITSPQPGQAFTPPATVQLTANASDIDGTIERVEFYSGLELLGTDEEEPYQFVWADLSSGSYAVVARAIDNLGATTDSVPVAFRVAVPSGPATFLWAATEVSVLESGGEVVLQILKTEGGAGSVNYSTAPGSAKAVNSEGYGDYLTVSGSLTFAALESEKSIAIPIVDDLGGEGNQVFYVLLGSTGDGSLISGPAEATVIIEDDEPLAGLGSELGILTPENWPAFARLQIHLVPAIANGRWRFAWENVWRDSGVTAVALTPGEYPIEFSASGGYVPPVAGEITLQSGANVVLTNYCVLAGAPATGSLRVILDPPTARWRLQTESIWRSSGLQVEGILVGENVIEFEPVSGRVTPLARRAAILPDEVSAVHAYYALTESWGATEPALVPLGSLQNQQDPYAFCGQLQTEVGSSSGYVVKPNVVLTAAHAVFDDAVMAFAGEARWFFQKHAGAIEPRPIEARGWYVFDGYAAQREMEDTPGQSSLTAYHLDVAAVYFLQPAGRGGTGGYLVSDDTNNWLMGPEPKMLVGYPVAGRDGLLPGELYATLASTYAFDLLSGSVYDTTDFRSYPGNSGGPICVLHDNGNTYPAAVYLGGSGRSVVRLIDAEVADLLNRAQLAAYTGDNNVGGGAEAFGPQIGGTSFTPGMLQVAINPVDLVSQGAGWRLKGSGDPAFLSRALHVQPLLPATYTLEFSNVVGWQTPNDRSVTVVGDQTAVVNVEYTPIGAQVFGDNPVIADGQLSLSITGVAGQTVIIEMKADLGDPLWEPVWTNAFTMGGSEVFEATVTETGGRFYRARAE